MRFHSDRKAFTGSTRVASQPGSKPAATATAPRIAATNPNALGSAGWTSYKILPSRRFSATAAASPKQAAGNLQRAPQDARQDLA